MGKGRRRRRGPPLAPSLEAGWRLIVEIGGSDRAREGEERQGAEGEAGRA